MVNKHAQGQAISKQHKLGLDKSREMRGQNRIKTMKRGTKIKGLVRVWRKTQTHNTSQRDSETQGVLILKCNKGGYHRTAET